MYILLRAQSPYFCGVGQPLNLSSSASLNFLSLAVSPPLSLIQIQDASLQNLETLNAKEYTPKQVEESVSVRRHRNKGFKREGVYTRFSKLFRYKMAFGVLFARLLFAQEEPCQTKPFPLAFSSSYKTEWDLSMSPYAGGENLLFGQRLIERTELVLLRKSPIVYSEVAAARSWRLSELVMFWFPINYFSVVVQHEIFGHGYRIRDINHDRAKVKGYSFGVPPPYGEGGGGTSYNVNENLTTTQEATIAIGGVEATAIYAWITKLKWLEAGHINARQAALYLFAEHDLDLYIGTLRLKMDRSGHDIHAYLRAVNYTYPDKLLTKERLCSLAWLNLADVFTFYSLYAWGHYLSSGKMTPIPMIANCFLPGLRLGLTPFGPELFLENFFVYKEQPFTFYLKGGNHADNTYYGAGLYYPRLFRSKKLCLGTRVDFWNQPKLLLRPGAIPIAELGSDQKASLNHPLYSSRERHKKRFGGAASLIAYWRGSPQYGFEAELGYKSRGYLPGYSLETSPIARLALTIVF